MTENGSTGAPAAACTAITPQRVACMAIAMIATTPKTLLTSDRMFSSQPDGALPAFRRFVLRLIPGKMRDVGKNSICLRGAGAIARTAGGASARPVKPNFTLWAVWLTEFERVKSSKNQGA